MKSIDIVWRWLQTIIQPFAATKMRRIQIPLSDSNKNYHSALLHSVHCIHLQKINGFATEIHISDPPQLDQTKAAVSFQRNRKG